MTISKPQVLEELRRVKGPNLDGNIVDLGLVSEILIKDDRVYFAITVPAARAESLEPLRQAAESVVAKVAGVGGVTVVLTAEAARGAVAPSAAPAASPVASPVSGPVSSPVSGAASAGAAAESARVRHPQYRENNHPRRQTGHVTIGRHAHPGGHLAHLAPPEIFDHPTANGAAEK